MRRTHDSPWHAPRATRGGPAIPRFAITDLATAAMTPPHTTTHGLLAPNKRLDAQQVKTLLPQATDVSSQPSPPRTTNRPARRAPSETRCRATTIPALASVPVASELGPSLQTLSPDETQASVTR